MKPDRLIQGYKGYIKEALLYPITALRSVPELLTKFVIFGIPRSGSTLLVSLLDSHPQIHCEGELLIHRLFFPRAYIHCRSKLCKKNIFGFKLLVDHFETQNISDSRPFLEDLVHQGYQIINLSRQNLYRAALSSLYGAAIGRYHLLQADSHKPRIKMNVQPEDLLAKLKRFEHLASRQEEILGDLPRLEIVYENDLVDNAQHQATVDRVADFLGIPRARVYSELIRVTSDDVADFVENSSELDNILRMSKYSKYVI